MAQNRTVADYGGPYRDQLVVSDPTAELAADKANRLMEDVAQMTRTSTKVDVTFLTTTTSGPVAVTPVAGQTQWGTGAFYYPSVNKSATGTYALTFASSVDDALVGGISDAISETENVVFDFATAVVMANSDAVCRCTVASNVITVYVRVGGALSDLGGSVAVYVSAK
jgi:hypothetical protein